MLQLVTERLRSQSNGSWLAPLILYICVLSKIGNFGWVELPMARAENSRTPDGWVGVLKQFESRQGGRAPSPEEVLYCANLDFEV